MSARQRTRVVAICVAVSALSAVVGTGAPAFAVKGGTTVDDATFASQWSFTVFLASTGGNSACTGTLVNADTVVTAAHCFDVEPMDVVLYGDTDFEEGTVVPISDVFVNPAWNEDRPDLGRDSAVVKLDDPVTGVTPIRLATEAETTALGSGFSARYAGWGLIDGGVETTVLHAATQSVKTNGPLFWENNTAPPPSTCSGDSGGPLVATSGGEEVLIGATSFGDAGCEFLSVWTNLGKDSFVQGLVEPPVTHTFETDVSPLTGAAPLKVRFDFAGSGFSDSRPVDFVVDPDTDGPLDSVDSTNPVITFTYPSQGSFEAFLGMRDGDDVVDSTTADIVVGPPPKLRVLDAQVTEGNPTASKKTTPMRFVITLSTEATTTVKVDVATSDGTAKSGADYKPVTTRLQFAPGDVKEVVTVPIIRDRKAEPTQQFTVKLSSPVRATLGRATARGTILDDD